VLVFQGASYFRAVGKGQGYGLSARGLAVDTRRRRARSSRASPSSGSSGRAAAPTSLVIHALLDSKRVAGAYRFVLTPGPRRRCR
jgi:glucans biosynthesis protein